MYAFDFMAVTLMLMSATAKRRNKWICALKAALAEVKIFGPKGDPSSVPAPVRQTLVPWEEVQENEHAAMRAVAKAPADTKMPAEGWKLSDNSTISMQPLLLDTLPFSYFLLLYSGS